MSDHFLSRFYSTKIKASKALWFLSTPAVILQHQPLQRLLICSHLPSHFSLHKDGFIGTLMINDSGTTFQSKLGWLTVKSSSKSPLIKLILCKIPQKSFFWNLFSGRKEIKHCLQSNMESASKVIMRYQLESQGHGNWRPSVALGLLAVLRNYVVLCGTKRFCVIHMCPRQGSFPEALCLIQQFPR